MMMWRDGYRDTKKKVSSLAKFVKTSDGYRDTKKKVSSLAKFVKTSDG